MSTSPPADASSTGTEFRFPPALVLLFGLLCVTAVISSFAPAGSFDRDAAGQVIPGTFAFDQNPVRPSGWSLVFAVLTAPVRGLVATADIVGFVLVIGGVFRMVEDTGALGGAIHLMVARLRGKEKLFIPLSMLVFATGGAVFGMSEEVIPFVLLFLPLVRALGYPPIIAVAIPVIGSGVGFAGAMINPFTVGVAQAIAGLPPMSGWPFRTVVWAVLSVLGIVYVFRRAQAMRGPVSERPEADTADASSMPRHQVVVLVVFFGAIASIAYGSYALGWYVVEVSGVFLAAGIVAAIAARMGAGQAASSFTEGAAALVPAALVIGLARGVVVIATDMRTLDPLLHGTASVMEGFSPFVSLGGMFAFQSMLNVLVPSGSGQAALTIPIMAPLSELIGLNRQLAVLAFQLGDGFTNLITPTSAVLMGSLHAAGVDYGRWLRFAGMLQVWLFVAGLLVLGAALLMGFGT